MKGNKNQYWKKKDNKAFYENIIIDLLIITFWSVLVFDLFFKKSVWI